MNSENLEKCEFYVEGMHCAACELLIEKNLSEAEGVKKVTANLNDGLVIIETDRKLNPEDLTKLVEKEGYRILQNKETLKKVNGKDLIYGFLIALIFFTAFLLLQRTGILNLTSTDGQITLPFIFLVGVLASLSTCMAVVGGLVLSLSSNYAKEEQIKPMVLFHISRIVGFFILGGLIGLIGSAFTLTPIISFVLNLVLFFVMIIMAINLLEIFPGINKFQLRMPKFIGERVMKVTDYNNAFTPLFLGAVTFFLPCGFTQSIQLYSLTTGSFINGAVTMLVFALGTLPVLALISFASTKLSKGLQSGLFFKTSAFIIIFFAIFNFIAALAAVGVIVPFFNI